MDAPPPRRPSLVPAHARDRTPPPFVPGGSIPRWQETRDERHKKPEQSDPPFGGWLILVVIGRLLAIPFSLVSLLRLWQTYSAPGVWLRLTSPGSPAYHPLWARVIVYELGGEAILFVWCAVLGWLCLGRKQTFRPAFIAYSLVLLAFLWGDHLLASALLGGRHPIPHDKLLQLIGQTIGALIGVQYFLMSERVGWTFVK